MRTEPGKLAAHQLQLKRLAYSHCDFEASKGTAVSNKYSIIIKFKVLPII